MKNYRERIGTTASWSAFATARAPSAAANSCRRMLNRSIRAAVPEFKGELTTRLVPVRDIYSSKVRLRLLLIFAASGLLLLIACTNIANLFLARVAGRATELATRIALGAGRARIVSHLLMESLLLSRAGRRRGRVGRP